MNIRHLFLTFIFALLLVAVDGQAQEYITGLSCNPTICKAAKMNRDTKVRGAASAVKLPFVEDFSNYTGYPNPALWTDRQAFVNNSYPILPPTVGVATLDAIDANGRIYPHANREGFSADTLTSVCIRLDSNFTLRRPMTVGDSLYFSFYYQPGGGCRVSPAVAWERVGNAPEYDDELILEFGYATGKEVFVGYEYGDYILGDDEFYVEGDTIDNPFMPGLIFVFENMAKAGDTVRMPIDSLFGPEYKWDEVWSSKGCSLDDWLKENSLQYFKQVMIPVTDPQYLRDNFQFRFRNYASLDIDSWNENTIVGWTSNCDQWHIDYIRLNSDRSARDIYPMDVAFVTPTTSALKRYQAMPWNQYRSSDMAPKFHNDLSNLSNATKNTYYNYQVKKNHRDNIYESTVNNENANPYFSNGLHNYDYHANPAIDFSYQYDQKDSAVFTITHVFRMEGNNDERVANDTCTFEQKFYNYYAYDDGTAEAGYCLLSSMSNPASSLAVQFTLAQPDTLRCVRMWFNSALNDENVENFTLMVWGDDNGKPGEVLYSLDSQLPAHAEEYLEFVNYYLDEPLAVEGTFYVGFTQNHNVQLNLGFDQNNDARGYFFYKTSSEWHESYYKGAPMIRPVLGKEYDHSGVSQREELACLVYPNPTKGKVHLVIEDNAGLDYQVSDIYGRVLKAAALEDGVIRLDDCAPGIYFIRLLKDHQVLTTKKIIKQ